MKTLTKAEARAGAMTKEEAGTATVERALQLEGSAIALLCREAITAIRRQARGRRDQRLPEGEAVQELAEGIPDSLVSAGLDLGADCYRELHQARIQQGHSPCPCTFSSR